MTKIREFHLQAIFWTARKNECPSGFRGLEFPDDGNTICYDWYNTTGGTDGLISGILADWIEDHREAMIGLGNSADHVNAVVNRLRLFHKYGGSNKVEE